MLVTDMLNIADALVVCGKQADPEYAKMMESHLTMNVHVRSMKAFVAMVESARNLGLHTEAEMINSRAQFDDYYYVFKIRNRENDYAHIALFSPHFPMEGKPHGI